MHRLTMISGLLLAVLTQTPLVQAAGDISPAMAEETIHRISAMYFISIPYLNEVLNQVPIKRATPEFLVQNGSSIGIYFHSTLYLNQSLIDAQGIQIDGAGFGILLHEAWHAYFDLLMPQDRKRSLENQWVSYYSHGGHSEEDSLVIGDEAIGNYVQSLATVYGFTVKRYQRDGMLRPSMLESYRRQYEGIDVFGYNSDDIATDLAISAPERAAFHQVSGGVFPSAANLLTTLAQRIGPVR